MELSPSWEIWGEKNVEKNGNGWKGNTRQGESFVSINHVGWIDTMAAGRRAVVSWRPMAAAIGESAALAINVFITEFSRGDLA